MLFLNLSIILDGYNSHLLDWLFSNLMDILSHWIGFFNTGRPQAHLGAINFILVDTCES